MSVLDDATIIYVPGVYKTSAAALQKPISAGSVSSLTFARASSGTRVNSAGLIESVATNIPRIDFLNDTCGSQLLEPARTNLLTYSQQFDNAAWTKTGATISANAASAPDGTLTADKLVEGSLNSVHRVQSTVTVTNAIHAVSCYMKAGERNTGKLQLYDVVATSTRADVYFDLSNGTVLSAAVGSGMIESLGDGWYKCTAISSVSMSAGVCFAWIAVTDSTNSAYSGDGTSGIYVCGAQLEVGAYPTSYIKTEALTVTRSAETLSQTGLASLLGDSEGTIYFEGFKYDAGGASMAISLSDGTLLNRITFGQNTSTTAINYSVTVGGVSQASLNGSNWIDGQYLKIAVKYATNNFALWVNGVEVATDLSGNTFGDGVLTRLGFDVGNGIVPFYGNVKALAVWDRALTDAELAELTT